MMQYLLMAGSAFFLAVSATPIVKRLAVRLGLVDRPAARKMHTRPVPLMGGIAIYLAFVVTLALLGDRSYVRETIGIFLGATLCSLVGLWDDRKALPALLKLAMQGLAAALMIASGVQVQLRVPAAVNIGLTLLWVVGITNAMNLLDNMDGLTAGVGVTASAFFLLLAAMNRQYLVGALAASMLGACIGFLVYNVNPASIFMGDSGALFIGFMLAAVGIKLRFPGNVNFVTWMVPVMVLGIPVFDTALVTFSRLRRRLNPLTTPGKDHLSHRLVKLGYTPRESVLSIHLACCALGVIGIYVMQATVVEGYALGGVVLAVAAGIILWLERVAPIGLNAPTSTPQAKDPKELGRSVNEQEA
jgi:UDP-GlcNAc:undecaprenyl-phosphate GlcNAc-1-phosphate transferase